MNNRIGKITIAIFVLCLFSSFTHKMFDSLDWQYKKVTADGKIPEWSNPLRFYDDKSKINYTLSNDRQNLYLCLKVSDETEQNKILRGGMEFKIDTSGKKSFPITFIFPIANEIVMVKHSLREAQQEKDLREKPNRASMNQKMLNHAIQAQLVGFKPPLGGTLSLLTNSSGISAAINVDSLGILYYEAIIPFHTFYKNELTAADTNTVFSYEIKVNALPLPPAHHGESSDGEMEAGGLGGGRQQERGELGEGGMRGGEHGGRGMRGGEHGTGNNFSQENNSELYVVNHVIKKLRFSFK